MSIPPPLQKRTAFCLGQSTSIDAVRALKHVCITLLSGLLLLSFAVVHAAEPAGPDPVMANPTVAVAPSPTSTNAVAEPVSSPASFDNADATSLSFGLHQVPALQTEVPAGIPLWQYLASLIYIFLAFVISKLLDYLTRLYLQRWTARTHTDFDDLLLSILNGPIKIVAFVILLHIGLRVFDWPDLVEDILAKALKIIVAISITYMTMKVIDLFLTHWRRRAVKDADSGFDEQLFPIIRRSLQVFVIVVAALLTSHNLGLNITSLIASLSIGGLALGLAAQDTLGNLFGAVSVFLDKPFRLGDRVRIGDIDGVVEEIGLRSTRIRNLDGHLITIPNKTMGNATITNITRRPNIKTVMNIGITYDTPVEKVRLALQLLDEVYRKHPMTFDVWISFNQFAESSLNILVIHWWNSTVYKDYLAGIQEMNLTVKQRFDDAGIHFAFPTRTLYVKQDSDWQFNRNGTDGKLVPSNETERPERPSNSRTP